MTLLHDQTQTTQPKSAANTQPGTALTTTIENQPMVIARRLRFSAAHLYNSQSLSEKENLETFGACYSRYGHGHNYVLEAFVSGPIDPITRLVMNIADLDRILKNAVEPLDHHHLNYDVLEFRDIVPTTENIGAYLRQRIAALLVPHTALKLERIRLFETEDLWVELTERPPVASGPRFELTREVVIRSIHHLENTQLTPEQNREIYGICYGKHGHNYRIQVTVVAELDPVSGMIFDRDRLDRILDASVVTPLDGMNLNEIFPNTSCEALARSLFLRIAPVFPPGVLCRIGVQETLKNYFEFPPSGVEVAGVPATDSPS